MITPLYPHNSHMIIMEHSSNFDETPSPPGKTHMSYSRDYKNNYSKSPFFMHSVGGKSASNVGIYDTLDDLHQNVENTDDKNNLFMSIKGFLIFGKLIGVLPYSGIFGNSWKQLSFRKRSLSAAISYVITAILIFNALLCCISSLRARKRNALEIANSIRASMYAVWGCMIYVIFIWRGNQFLKIFQVWAAVNIRYSKKDVTLRRDTLLITGAILISAFFENGVLHMEYFKEFDNFNGRRLWDDSKNKTTLEVYYGRAHFQWATIVGYNWFFAIVAFIQHKWILYTWNYMDITIAVFGRAMYFRFKSLLEKAEEKLLGPGEIRLTDLKRSTCNDHKAWVQVVHDHQNLCQLLDVMEDFFSPNIFASFSINMYYICLQLLDGVTSDGTNKSIVHAIYAPWSFLHLVMRGFIVAICCARINDYAHKIRKIFQECPVELYTTEISRIDKRVTAGPDIGLTGLGCFTVTKPFILSMLSVIFTFEIVLLQCIPDDDPPASC